MTLHIFISVFRANPIVVLVMTADNYLTSLMKNCLFSNKNTVTNSAESAIVFHISSFFPTPYKATGTDVFCLKLLYITYGELFVMAPK